MAGFLGTGESCWQIVWNIGREAINGCGADDFEFGSSGEFVAGLDNE